MGAVETTANPAGDTPVERIEKFAVEWRRGSHRGNELYGLNLGEGARHAELLMSDLRAVLSDRADLLAALVRIRDGSHEHSSAYSVALAAISKATGDA
jgi:hypothetical protein